MPGRSFASASFHSRLLPSERTPGLRVKVPLQSHLRSDAARPLLPQKRCRLSPDRRLRPSRLLRTAAGGRFMRTGQRHPGRPRGYRKNRAPRAGGWAGSAQLSAGAAEQRRSSAEGALRAGRRGGTRAPGRGGPLYPACPAPEGERPFPANSVQRRGRGEAPSGEPHRPTKLFQNHPCVTWGRARRRPIGRCGAIFGANGRVAEAGASWSSGSAGRSAEESGAEET